MLIYVSTLRSLLALAVMCVDVITEIYLSLLFAIPLYRGRWADKRIRSIALRSLCASTIAMTSSTANLAILGISGWHEVMSMCVITCCLDTLINISGIFAVSFLPSAGPLFAKLVFLMNTGNCGRGKRTERIFSHPSTRCDAWT